MATRRQVADILDPLIADVDRLLEGRGEHDPLVLVRDRLQGLIRGLRDDAAPSKKMAVLAELGFLSEHSVREDMTSFHDAVEQAIQTAMQPGWD